jgi:hypothetical protein
LKGSASNFGSTSLLDIEYAMKNNTTIPTILTAVRSKLFGSSKDLINGIKTARTAPIKTSK